MSRSTNSSSTALPPTHRALRQDTYASRPTVQQIQTPQPTPGSAVLKVEAANVISYTKDIYNGVRKYPYPTPLTLGSSAIGRIVALGPDATTLRVGDLCFLDITISGRDDVDGNANSTFLSAIHDGFGAASKGLMSQAWRDGTYAEYVRWPLENCHRVDETKMFKARGYNVQDLMYISKIMVPYGGMGPGCVDVKPGETVIVSPATGSFGSAAVHVALSLGAGKVVAMGRNVDVLEKVKSVAGGGGGGGGERVVCVKLTGDYQTDLDALKVATADDGGADVFFDTSPPAAAGSTHVKAGIMSLKKGGRCVLMGGIAGDVALPHLKIMHWGITIKGKWMFEPVDVKRMINLIETGVVKLHNPEKGEPMIGAKCLGTFGLDDWEKAFDEAERVGSDGYILLKP
ncbi:uncharacterized protein PV06_03807 [Exophiala oligosperma]|uniref:Alcohol dehydrogenase-like C-terminal domain-containing protein n=1 Tax=Exophiala oligosperma TaxID=215243 RepID=A0A0D2EBQ9_9EURO|nr:uncharacterized protein PV06_03807 [Exophiala oligosperma]KIW45414.1 hypothetical protein PV06_03807 [Exophiala oligosperma]